MPLTKTSTKINRMATTTETCRPENIKNMTRHQLKKSVRRTQSTFNLESSSLFPFLTINSWSLDTARWNLTVPMKPWRPSLLGRLLNFCKDVKEIYDLYDQAYRTCEFGKQRFSEVLREWNLKSCTHTHVELLL